MTAETLRRRFNEIGARLQVIDWTRDSQSFFRIQVRPADRFERFEISCSNVLMDVADMDHRRRQLLLLARWTERDGRPADNRFLCGFDERHWFAAQLPVAPGATPETIDEAREALKPPAVRRSQEEWRVPGRMRNERHNAGFIRQGEWFFIPRPELSFEIRCAHQNAELSRGLGRPHVVQYLVGDASRLQRSAWQLPDSSPAVYARGQVRHRDHRTIKLPFWHEVALSEELPSGGWGCD